MARPPRRGKNLVVRGDTYYFRKTIKGKPYMVSTDVRAGGSPEFALAEKRARQIENDINEGRFGFKKEEEKKESATVGVWCDRMMRSHVALLAPGTQSSYAFATLILRTTKAPFAVWEDRDMREITEEDAKMMLVAAEKGTLKAVNTRRTFQVNCGSIWNHAIKAGLADTNPWLFKKPNYIARKRVLSYIEQDLLMSVLPDYYKRSLTVEVWTGLRSGCELTRLKIGHVDKVRKQIHVVRGKGSKERWVPLSPEAEAAIDAQVAANACGVIGNTGQTSARMKRLVGEGYVFPIVSERALRAWRDAAHSVGIEHFTSHDLRRTFGTRCAENGVPMKKLQQWMGHSDIKVTAEFYIHLQDEGDQRMLAKIAEVQTAAVEQKPVVTEVGTVVSISRNS